ncbi:MAG: PH domain-containing protein [Lachnospiraceae bacterium]|jgi:hypothetical protein|nr:PH domain-containing protein [Lachnospiraceae bacterium]
MRKNTRLLNALIVITIFVGVSLYFAFFSGKSIMLKIDTEGLLITCSGQKDSLIKYSDIEDYDLINKMDAGEMISGEKGDRIHYGLWKNDTYGFYKAYYDPKIDAVIIIKTDKDIYALNYDTKATTESLYNEMGRIIAHFTQG